MSVHHPTQRSASGNAHRKDQNSFDQYRHHAATDSRRSNFITINNVAFAPLVESSQAQFAAPDAPERPTDIPSICFYVRLDKNLQYVLSLSRCASRLTLVHPFWYHPNIAYRQLVPFRPAVCS